MPPTGNREECRPRPFDKTGLAGTRTQNQRLKKGDSLSLYHSFLEEVNIFLFFVAEFVAVLGNRVVELPLRGTARGNANESTGQISCSAARHTGGHRARRPLSHDQPLRHGHRTGGFRWRVARGLALLTCVCGRRDGIAVKGNEHIHLDDNSLIDRIEVAWRPLASAVLIQEKLANVSSRFLSES